jgi:uncharacterized membrane protein YdjX (TVP38/TMEM64 family)
MFSIVCFPGVPQRLRTFLIVSIIGRLPGTYLLTMQGASIRNQQYLAAAIFAVIAAAILLLAYLYRGRIYDWIKYRHQS